MRKIILPVILFFIGSSLLISCKKDDDIDTSDIHQGQLFFPAQVGKYIVYDVDSTYWDDVLKAEIHHRCQLRYDVADSFYRNGVLSYKVNILRRPTPTDDYSAVDVIYYTPSENRVEVTQKNLHFIKMVFPVSNGVSWNGNALIPVGDSDYQQYANDQWNYSYANFDQPFDPGNNLYQHTVTVNQIDYALGDPELDSNAVAARNYAQEVYAYQVGLIYQERIYWTFEPAAEGGSGYRKGYGVLMKAVDNN